MAPPLPPQVVVSVITLDDKGSFHTILHPSDRSVGELVAVVLSSINIDTHDFVYTNSPPPSVSELKIEAIIKNPSAAPWKRWRDLMQTSSTFVTLYVLPKDRPGATETVNAAIAHSASPSEYADYSVFSASQTQPDTRLVDGYFVHDKTQLNPSLACVPARFFYDGFITAAKDLRRIKSEGLEELKARAAELFGCDKIVKNFTPDTAVERAHGLSSQHTKHYADEKTLRTMTEELGTELLELERLNDETTLKVFWVAAKEAKVDGIRGLGGWPLIVEEWKEDGAGAGAGHERLQGAQGFRKHLISATKVKTLPNAAHVHALVNLDRGVFPGLVLSHRGADVTVCYMLRVGNCFVYEVGETMRLSKDGATNARNELGDTRVAVFFGTLARLSREMYAFLNVPGIAPCLSNVLCGGQGEFGPESNRLQEGNPRVLKTTWTPPGASRPLDVVVKFMTKSSYGKKAQELAGRFAPTLRYYGHIDEGFYVAVMDFVPGPSGVGLNVVHERTLQELRRHFKDNDIVHGDVRPQNLVFGVDGSVTVLDWDWGGVRSKENPRYPMAMNPEWKWHRGVVGGGLLEHEHDCYELDKLHAEIDKMKTAAAQKRKAEEDAQGAEERRGSAPTSR